MRLSDREKITSRTSEKNQRACMYVGRPIQTKPKVKTNQQRFLKIQGRGARKPGGAAAALFNNNKKASHREKITSRISFSLPRWYDGSSRGLWNHETSFNLRDFLPLLMMMMIMMMMMMMQHATPLSPPPRRHPSFFQNHFQHTNQSKNKREREREREKHKHTHTQSSVLLYLQPLQMSTQYSSRSKSLRSFLSV